MFDGGITILSRFFWNGLSLCRDLHFVMGRCGVVFMAAT
jgi:hypothetical protein